MTPAVLVTGGAGFIGSHVVDRLLAAGRRPRILDTRASPWHGPAEVDTVIGDVRSIDEVARALQGCDAVCHLAAAADVAEVHAEPAWATELNAMGTLNVLEAARREGVRRFVYASTVWVYSDVDADVVDEDSLLPSPAHLYTATKLSGELYCHAYGKLYGLDPTVLRFGIPYGPRGRPAAVVPSFVGRALRGEALTIAGDGDQERSFVYVEDLADGVVRALESRAAGRTYNLGGRETITVRRLAELVRDEVADVEIVYAGGRAGDLRGATVLSDRAERELGWRATTPMREGIRRYVSWMREQPAVAAVPTSVRPPAEGGVRGAARRLTAAALDPVLVGAVAVIAVVSSLLPTLVATDDRTQAAGVTMFGISLILPLWSLTVGRWPADLRSVQALLAVLAGVTGVLLLGFVSPEELGELGWYHARLVLACSVAAASVLHVVPRRLDEDARSG